MKTLRLIRNTALRHKYLAFILGLVVIGTGGVVAVQHIPDQTSSWSRPQTQSSQSQPDASSPSSAPSGSTNNSPSPSTATPDNSTSTVPATGGSTYTAPTITQATPYSSSTTTTPDCSAYNSQSAPIKQQISYWSTASNQTESAISAQEVAHNYSEVSTLTTTLNEQIAELQKYQSQLSNLQPQYPGCY